MPSGAWRGWPRGDDQRKGCARLPLPPSGMPQAALLPTAAPPPAPTAGRSPAAPRRTAGACPACSTSSSTPSTAASRRSCAACWARCTRRSCCPRWRRARAPRSRRAHALRAPPARPPVCPCLQRALRRRLAGRPPCFLLPGRRVPSISNVRYACHAMLRHAVLRAAVPTPRAQELVEAFPYEASAPKRGLAAFSASVLSLAAASDEQRRHLVRAMRRHRRAPPRGWGKGTGPQRGGPAPPGEGVRRACPALEGLPIKPCSAAVEPPPCPLKRLPASRPLSSAGTGPRRARAGPA